MSTCYECGRNECDCVSSAIAEAEARGYQWAIDAQDVRAEVLKTAARALLAEAEAYDAKWLRQIRQPDTSDWDKGYVAGLKRAAHDVANSIDRPVEASAQTAIRSGESTDDDR